MQSPSQATARTAVTKLYQEVDGKIDQFCDSAWERFAAGKPAMNYKQFVEMTQEFPQISQWLTDLGQRLSKQFRNLSQQTDRDKESDSNTDGTILSVARVQQTFTRFAVQGSMDKAQFFRCVHELGVENRGFVSSLFAVLDVNSNGSIAEDEFTDAFTTIVTGTPEQQCKISFRIHDTGATGCLDAKSLRSFFATWFDNALKTVDSLANALDEWVVGTCGGVNDVVVKREIGPGTCLKKAAAREVSMFSDAMAEHALNSTNSTQMYFAEFCRWLHSTKFSFWLSALGQPWLATAEAIENETAPSDKRAVSRTQALLASGTAECQRIAKAVSAGEGYFGLTGRHMDYQHKSDSLDVWWHRLVSSRRNAVRQQVKPSTALDFVTLDDLARVIELTLTMVRRVAPLTTNYGILNNTCPCVDGCRRSEFRGYAAHRAAVGPRADSAVVAFFRSGGGGRGSGD
jgi:Ca2+-binding EF-hand superfamily protein